MALFLLYHKSGKSDSVVDRIEAKNKTQASDLLRKKKRIRLVDFRKNYVVKKYEKLNAIDRRNLFSYTPPEPDQGLLIEEPKLENYEQAQDPEPSKEEVQKYGYWRAKKRKARKIREENRNRKNAERKRIEERNAKIISTTDSDGRSKDNFGNFKPLPTAIPNLLSDNDFIDKKLPPSYQKGNIGPTKGQLCANCTHWKLGQCGRWEAKVRPQYWCKSWDKGQVKLVSGVTELKTEDEIKRNAPIPQGPVERLWTEGGQFIFKNSRRPYTGYYSISAFGEFLAVRKLNYVVSANNRNSPNFQNKLLEPADEGQLREIVAENSRDLAERNRLSNIEAGIRGAGGTESAGPDSMRPQQENINPSY